MDRKAEILEAAKEIFAERGVKQTTVRQIGAKAGILSGSLYHHFESKLDIVDAILSDFCSEVLAGYRSIARGDDPAPDRLRKMIRYAFNLIPHHSAAVVIILNDSQDLLGDPRFRYLVDFNTEVERRWIEVFREGMRTGAFRDSFDPKLLYRFARDAILGANRWYEPTKAKSIDVLADEYADVLILGIHTPQT